MRTRNTALLILSLAVCVPLLVGCGGSGGGSGATGRVVGRVFQHVGGTSRAPVTIAVDGTALSTVAGPDGRFTLNSVPAGLHTVYAKSDVGAIAVVVEVSGGAQTNVGDLQLADAGQISGLVTASVDGHTTPIPGALVTVSQVTPSADTTSAVPGPVRTTRTNAQGSYTVDGLPVGDYLVSVSAPGYESASIVAAVTAGRTTVGDVTLTAAPAPATGSMTGTAYLQLDDGSKQPLAGALVRVAKLTDPEPLRPMPATAVMADGSGSVSFAPGNGMPYPGPEFYAFTDENGKYTLTGVPEGDYTAVAVRRGLVPDRKPVTIKANAAVTLDFTLTLQKPSTGTITGKVTDGAGSPIQGAQVSVYFMPPVPYDMTVSGGAASVSAPGDPRASSPIFITPDDLVLWATTDAQGNYKLVTPAGPQLVTAYADGYLTNQVQVDVPLSGQVTANIPLEKDPGQLTLTGRTLTKDAAGNVIPVPNAEVDAAFYVGPGIMAPGAMGSMPSMILTTTSDDQGKWSLSLRAGAYYLSAYAQGLFAPPVKVDVGPNPTPVDLVLEPATTDSGGGGGTGRAH